MNDPLAAFRRKPLERQASETNEKAAYLAFAGKDRVERLRIRRANGPTRSPGYNTLLDVVYDGDFGTNFVLVYTDRKSTRLNSSHLGISYAVFCLNRGPTRSTLFPYTTLFRSGPTRSPGYNTLLDVVYDGDFGTNFVLVYTFMMVLVRGRNLQGLVLALETSTADFIQEYDSDRWAKPTDETAAFIESIEVVVKTSADAVSDSENVKLTKH